MKKTIIFLTLFSFLVANDIDQLDLLNDLNNISEISTKTKLNINKTPSIISILHADRLKKLGIVNLFDALGTVPGIQTSIGAGGAKQINMRGNRSLARDKIKLMINGISINNETLGGSFLYLDMPIENIERIEIIRGPASTIYGSFAHIGVINVITKSANHEKNIYFISKSSKNNTNTGFTQNLNLGSMKLSLDASFTNNENSRETGPYSLLPSPAYPQSYSSYEDFTYTSVGAIMKLKDNLSLQARFAQRDAQNYYGYGAWPITQDPKKLKTTSMLAEIMYTPKISTNLSLDVHVGFKDYVFEGLSRLQPLQLRYFGASPDLIGDGFYHEQVFYIDNAIKYTFDKHDLLFGVYLSQAKEGDTTYKTNIHGSLTPPGIKSDIVRNQYAFYLNDIYNISDKFVANLGLRYDNYSDVGSNTSHKLALLYKQDEKQNYKLMYQRSFKAPAWLELYGTISPFIGNESLQPETINTYELAYRYQSRFNSFFNINLFYSNIENFIYRDSSLTFQNGKHINSYGSEIEFEVPLFNTTSLQTNYSYVHIQDSDGNNMPFVANHLANIMLSTELNNNFSIASRIHYVGSKAHALDDDTSRDDVSGYTTFDQTLTYTYKEVSVQLSVKNLFDQEILSPSPSGNETTSGTYIEDFQRDGRTFWISAQWKFE